MLRYITIALIALFLSAAAAPAQAQQFCGDRAEILKTLEGKHGEQPQSIGLSQDGALVEIMVSPGGSWTILVTYPNKPTCVVSTGQDWQNRIVVAGETV